MDSIGNNLCQVGIIMVPGVWIAVSWTSNPLSFLETPGSLMSREQRMTTSKTTKMHNKTEVDPRHVQTNQPDIDCTLPGNMSPCSLLWNYNLWNRTLFNLDILFYVFFICYWFHLFPRTSFHVPVDRPAPLWSRRYSIQLWIVSGY